MSAKSPPLPHHRSGSPSRLRQEADALPPLTLDDVTEDSFSLPNYLMRVIGWDRLEADDLSAVVQAGAGFEEGRAVGLDFALSRLGRASEQIDALLAENRAAAERLRGAALRLELGRRGEADAARAEAAEAAANAAAAAARAASLARAERAVGAPLRAAETRRARAVRFGELLALLRAVSCARNLSALPPLLHDEAREGEAARALAELKAALEGIHDEEGEDGVERREGGGEGGGGAEGGADGRAGGGAPSPASPSPDAPRPLLLGSGSLRAAREMLERASNALDNRLVSAFDAASARNDVAEMARVAAALTGRSVARDDAGSGRLVWEGKSNAVAAAAPAGATADVLASHALPSAPTPAAHAARAERVLISRYLASRTLFSAPLPQLAPPPSAGSAGPPPGTPRAAGPGPAAAGPRGARAPGGGPSSGSPTAGSAATSPAPAGRVAAARAAPGGEGGALARGRALEPLLASVEAAARAEAPVMRAVFGDPAAAFRAFAVRAFEERVIARAEAALAPPAEGASASELRGWLRDGRHALLAARRTAEALAALTAPDSLPTDLADAALGTYLDARPLVELAWLRAIAAEAAERARQGGDERPGGAPAAASSDSSARPAGAVASPSPTKPGHRRRGSWLSFGSGDSSETVGATPTRAGGDQASPWGRGPPGAGVGANTTGLDVRAALDLSVAVREALERGAEVEHDAETAAHVALLLYAGEELAEEGSAGGGGGLGENGDPAAGGGEGLGAESDPLLGSDASAFLPALWRVLRDGLTSDGEDPARGRAGAAGAAAPAALASADSPAATVAAVLATLQCVSTAGVMLRLEHQLWEQAAAAALAPSPRAMARATAAARRLRAAVDVAAAGALSRALARLDATTAALLAGIPADRYRDGSGSGDGAGEGAGAAEAARARAGGGERDLNDLDSATPAVAAAARLWSEVARGVRLHLSAKPNREGVLRALGADAAARVLELARPRAFGPAGALRWKRDLQEARAALDQAGCAEAAADLSRAEARVPLLVVPPASLLFLAENGLSISAEDAAATLRMRQDAETASVDGVPVGALLG